MNVEINPEVLKELQYLVHLHKRHGAPNAFDNVADLIAYVLAAVADGSRRPGAWERSMLDSMGLVAECDEHVAALRSVLAVFDNQENRDPERRPREFAVLQGVYQALGRPWPAGGSTTAE